MKKLCNEDRPTCYESMASDCCDNVRLASSPKALLRFYAGCKTGFRPSTKLIERMTGILPNHIARARQQLHDRGLITVTDETITIEWEHIRAFAIAGQMSAKDVRTGTFMPGRQKSASRPRPVSATGQQGVSHEHRFAEFLRTLSDSEVDALFGREYRRLKYSNW